MTRELMQPVVVLVAWTLLVLLFLLTRRLPALKAAGIDLATVRGSRPGVLDGVVPASAQWPAHNYMHLVEQPTLFYAIALVLAAVGGANPLNVALAWGYVALRIAHSLVQIFGNVIRYRFALFMLSTAVLIAFVVSAAVHVF